MEAVVGVIGIVVSTLGIAYSVATRGSCKVIIVNDCPWVVRIHAASGDDDCGTENVSPGNAFVFSFSPNIWGTTEFWSDVSSDGRRAHFTVYKGRDTGTFVFSVRNDGIYNNEHRVAKHQ